MLADTSHSRSRGTSRGRWGRRQYFRCMTPDSDGQPLVGRGKRRLGVVPEEVRVRPDGWLEPGHGGMSVAPDAIENLPNHLRPKGWGGGSTGASVDRIYSIQGASIEAAGLAVRLDNEVHGLVEPTTPIPLSDFERVLGSTRSNWETEWPA